MKRLLKTFYKPTTFLIKSSLLVQIFKICWTAWTSSETETILQFGVNLHTIFKYKYDN